MEIEIKKYLFDIQQACLLISEFTRGQAFETYQMNAMMRSAVERQFITIGEAMNQILKRKPELEADITAARKVVDFRNVLTHGYTSVSNQVVWDIVQTDLPKLQQEVSQLLTG
jgi:uncharacterized protein with HEPN domain